MKKVIANNLKVGDIIDYNNGMYSILSLVHTKPGKGGAFMKVELRSLANLNKLSVRFRSSEKVTLIFVEESECTYLYSEDSSIFILDQDNNVIEVDCSFIGEKVALLEENMKISVLYYNNKPFSIKLPKNISVVIKSADLAAKNQTVTASFKNAEIQGRIKIQVPTFINPGDEIIISTEDMKYISRIKKA